MVNAVKNVFAEMSKCAFIGPRISVGLLIPDSKVKKDLLVSARFAITDERSCRKMVIWTSTTARQLSELLPADEGCVIQDQILGAATKWTFCWDYFVSL